VKAATERGVRETIARHLVGAYGSEAAAVLNLADRDRTLGQPIIVGRPELWAEVAHTMEREMALRVSDVLIRRLHLFYLSRDQALSVASAVADRMAEILGWDEARRAEEVASYVHEVERSRAFVPEVAGLGKP
jgi:glycerol-3-phosphate dehydrogenase